MTDSIAVIGATGMLGKPVTLQLINAGFNVTALARDPEKAKKEFPSGIQWIKGDVRNRRDVDKMLEGHQRLYISLNLKRSEGRNVFHAEAEGLKNILASAKAKEIQHIGFISSLVMNYQGMNGFNWWVFDLKRKAVDMIRSSGIPYTIFYPSTFMENFHSTYRLGNKVLLAGESKQKMYFISAIDFGKQVAKAFEKNAVNKEYVIQGLEAFTADEAAEIFIRHYAKGKLSISRAPLGMLKFIGNFSAAISYGYHIIEALNNYPERFEAENTWKDLGKPTITLREFAEGKLDNPDR